MANIFKPKRGNGVPSSGVLEDGELGVSLDNKQIFIGSSTGAPIPLGGSGGTVITQDPVPFLNTPFTTLERKGCKLAINFHNLDASETYTLRCYTVSRKKGNKYGKWYYPEKGIGYALMAGKAVGHLTSGITYQAVPSWMPNNGFLQVEWAIQGTDKSKRLSLDGWLVPMCKPCDSSGNGTKTGNFLETTGIAPTIRDYYIANMIGVDANTLAGKLFKFCLRDSSGNIYPCLNTLKVGQVINTSQNTFTFQTDKNGSSNTTRLFSIDIYTSII